MSMCASKTSPLGRQWLMLLLVMNAMTWAASSAEKLVGTWECYVDYETHTLRFLSADELELDGEAHFYTLKANAIEANYETYPFRFEGDALVVTADGRDVRFTRVIQDPPQAAVEIKDLLGYWKSQTDWGVQYLNVISNTELEAGGESLTYTLVPNAVRVNGSDYPYTFENGQLTVTIPEEGRKVTFVRDDSVFIGAWVAQVDGVSVPLTILSEDELEYDYQYATYELVPGAVRVDGMDYSYRFEGKYLVAGIDGREVQFQRDVTQLLGTWQGTSQGHPVLITFLSDKQLRSEGKVSSYYLTPGSIHADNKCIPYRMRKGHLVLAIPEEGEVVLTKVKNVTPSSWQALQGTWQAQRDWETLKLNIFSASQLSYNGETADYSLVEGAVRVDYVDYPYHLEGNTLVVTIDGASVRFTRTVQ